MTLELAHLSLHSITFEARFDQSPMLWDRAGAFSSGAHEIHPTIKLGSANPSNIVFSVDRNYQISIQLDKLSITYFPTSTFHPDEFAKTTNKYLSLCKRLLELLTYSRVGLRMIYRKKFNSLEAASSAINETGLLKVPSGKHFDIEGKALLPHYAMRWEDQSFGVTANLMAQEKKMLVEPPAGELEIDPVNIDLFLVIFDLDYFSVAPITSESFDAEMWVQKVIQVIKRDSPVFLGR